MRVKELQENAHLTLSLSQRLKALIAATDIEKDPMLVSNGARVLSEVQQWEEKGESLQRRVSALEQSAATAGEGPPASLADWAHEVLLDAGVAMPYREIAAVIKSRGFKHAREPKNPEKQLADSVWTAMYEDDRFTKVGRGIFDLTDRLQGTQ
jgi:HB1/ASXL restriction endonuclease-like protein with HTH domain